VTGGSRSIQVAQINAGDSLRLQDVTRYWR